MELFDLVAKLTLDSKDYESALNDAESKGAQVEDLEATLSLDDDDFTEKIDDANDVEVDDPDTPTLSLDDKPYSDALEQTQADTETWSGAVGDIFNDLKGVIAAAGITAVLSGIVSSLSEAVDLARSMGDNIDKSSRAMSISTDAYQEWSHVMDINGASITDLNRGLMNMRKLMGGGEAPKEFAAAMVQLGLASEDAEGNITSQFNSTEEALMAAMKALADFDTSTEEKLAQRDYLAQAIFGRGGTKLNAMFDGTSKDIDALIQQAHDLGLVMTEEEVSNAAAYNDAVTNMNASMDAFKTSMVKEILPVLTDVFNKVASIIAFFNPRTHENGLSEQFKETDKQLSKDLASIEGTSEAALDLIDKLFSMGEAEKLTAEQQAEWKETADWLIENIPSLSDVIDKDTQKITANKDEVGALIDEWKKLSQERAVANAKEAKYEAMLEENAEAIDKQAEARAKSNDALKKQYERIAIANDLMKKNTELSNMFSSIFGTSTIDKNAENLQDMLDWLHNVGYEFADTKEFEDATDAYNELSNEAKKSQEEAEKFDEQLKKAQDEYDAWLQAIDELYGVADDQAEGATESVDALNASLGRLPAKKTVQIDILTNRLLPFAKGNWNVPYDMPAMVHRGETILTSSEARRYRSGEGSGDVDLSGLRSEIVGAIREGMQDAQVNSYLDGRRVSEEVNRYNNSDLASRRFAP